MWNVHPTGDDSKDLVLYQDLVSGIFVATLSEELIKTLNNLKLIRYKEK